MKLHVLLTYVLSDIDYSMRDRVDCLGTANKCLLKKNPCHFTLFISQLLSVKLNKFAKKCKTISLLRHQNKNWVRLKKSLTIIKLNYTIQDLKYYTKETIKTNHNFLAIFVKDILKLRYVS